MNPDGNGSFLILVVFITVKALISSIVILLIVRSLTAKIEPFISLSYIQFVYDITEPFVNPVRVILPPILWKRHGDYSPLVASIILLFIGFGIKTCIMIVLQSF
jgi:uncharacterized protein YggT (Ycf19 family)